MGWKICHIVFGWDYIAWQSYAAQGVARVYRSQCGRVYFWRYPITKVVGYISKPSDVLWLTCKPEKYLGS